jgi:hypothetical protein
MNTLKIFVYGGIVIGITVLIALMVLYFLKPSGKPLFKYERSGGFAGFREELVFYNDGRVVFRDLKLGGEKEIFLDDEARRLIEYLHNELSEMEPVSVVALQGAADFFNYRVDLNGKVFEWVDPAVAEGEFPERLLDFHRIISTVISDKIMGNVYYGGFRSIDNIWVSVELNKYSCGVNEPVNIRIIVENRGMEAFSYDLPTPCHPDVSISSDLDYTIEYVNPVFTADTVCIQVVQTKRINAGERLENSAVIRFSRSGIAHVRVTFPFEALVRSVVEVSIPVLVLD